jgi:hypothetical protein
VRFGGIHCGLMAGMVLASVLSPAAAAYVITHDYVIRSGAVSVTEMLRLAPNL